MPRACKGAYRLLKPRHKVFVDAFIACNFNASEAARRCGMANPEVRGPWLARQDRIKLAVDERLVALRTTLRMEAEEVLEITTKVARDFKHPGQLRALEMLAKVHGLTSDTLPFDLDRPKLLRAVQMELDRIAGVKTIDAEVRVIPQQVES